MKVLGTILAIAGLLIAGGALLMDITAGEIGSSGIVNLSRLQAQMLVFVGGWGVCLAGLVLAVGGWLGELVRPQLPGLDAGDSQADLRLIEERQAAARLGLIGIPAEGHGAQLDSDDLAAAKFKRENMYLLIGAAVVSGGIILVALLGG